MATQKIGEINRGSAGRGRPKGSPNKSTASTKAALSAAFTKLGGVPALVRWGQKNPSDFYKLWGRLIPTEVSGPDGGAIPVAALLVLPPEAS